MQGSMATKDMAMIGPQDMLVLLSILSLSPVSYTHLDVYKRQLLLFP